MKICLTIYISGPIDVKKCKLLKLQDSCFTVNVNDSQERYRGNYSIPCSLMIFLCKRDSNVLFLYYSFLVTYQW